MKLGQNILRILGFNLKKLEVHIFNLQGNNITYLQPKINTAAKTWQPFLFPQADENM